MNSRKLFLALLLLNAGTSFAATALKPELQKELQQIVDTYHQTHHNKEQFTAISAAVLIPTEKQLDPQDIHSFVAGTIGFPPYTQAVTTDNLFEIGSITKSFTAAIMLQLQIEGKLSLNDKLGKWLPQYANWKEVPLRRLLNMTSGIPNYSNNPVFLKQLYGDLNKHWTNEQLLSYAHPETPLKKQGQNQFDYSNSNYILAALIIEKITNDTFENQLNQRILRKGDTLANSFYPSGPDGPKIKASIQNRMVHGYFYDTKTNKNVDTYQDDLSWAAAAGAIVSNPSGVVQWVQILYHGLLFKPTYREDTLADLETIVSMKTGKAIATVSAEDPLGFGLGVGYVYDPQSKSKFWFYEGSTLGFRVLYLWQACNGVTTVVALNSKAAEGDKNSKLGNDIRDANLAMYNTILKSYPDLRCEV